MYTLLPVLNVFSRILIAFAFSFLVPLAWAWSEDHEQYRYVWEGAFALAAVSGLAVLAATRRHRRELQARDGFLLVNLVWIVLPAYAALPLLFTVPGIGWTKAYFEAMSALTATGATALSGLDYLPVSVNVWRCFLQLVGGLGIMLLVVAVLPMLGLGGYQVYKAETPGPMKDAKFTPRISETARGLWGVYAAFSVACMLAYRWAGMSWADAFMHMCTTMGLGGFSSHDASLGHFSSPTIEAVATVFMALAGISFVRYFIVIRSRSLRPIIRDREIRTYVTVLLASIGLIASLLLAHGVYDDAALALRTSAFHVVSLATTTGYASTDYAQWPVFAPVLLLFLGCFVSCAGSTGGGIKMVRMVLLIKQARRELVRSIHPRVVNPVTMGGAILPMSVMNATFGFMLIYGAVTMGLTMLLLFTGLDIVTAFSAVVATVNNIGPGLGQVGPASNFGVLSGFQIWVLTFAMLLGRLELLTVLVLFTGSFWRK
ncbi:MAG TPA: potassium transporter Trk [Hydrogenophaga sp.]|jgi:trk system potassium uptake protein TrkH|uniref:TrkH family potassium uptake protein n=1 Tax=Hydrogenophaga sp. TaxID=1904254 RepID=UPI0008D01A01|nr:potassium transporter TrkG [Hydrogenophaga sp.]MBU4180371.1 TrkH family potassium uptake protein [Gammaproteobacteria bacterium]OGA75735.1 MAG: potassium transporter Trk [Burkholderiales bacterium GWE1_65_30]OGA90283.1 MAG: potassium transporter Trk [Burkholderiales bacterium GWF1_66_17]OGB18529.1 MAG: potassium transporter Trk [Burkholderiales bacterium RIFCSPHIGHO2_02_FULL_66_10]OGB35104.1 MAG: potassium transporter Trk [Burkholderiales bacterium RIFCSPLOWO2_02_FULL_66_35]PKO77835.1 MAG: